MRYNKARQNWQTLPEGDCIPFRNVSGPGVLLMRVETFGKELKTPSREGSLFNVIPAKAGIQSGLCTNKRARKKRR